MNSSDKEKDKQYLEPFSGQFEDKISLARYASTRYLQYAIATVKDRALPRLVDGQKPVQARILYAMWEMNAREQNARKKSARVVGDVLGKFHPHGDSSVYDAMVRMSQDFTLRYPLIDGEGNFGSRDGDAPAAMRYTEARLTRLSSILLSELNQGTVKFNPNYDGSMDEPAQLPARLPVLMLNGASGIAVGMATEIPSHNIREIGKALISLIKRPKQSVKQLVRTIRGPDFAGGAQIISSSDEIVKTYETGRGGVRVRATLGFESLARGQWQLVVSELPPGVSSKKIMEEIDSLTIVNVKTGRKNSNVDQQKEKQWVLAMLDQVRDESDRTNPVRLVFEPRSSKVRKSEFINLLLTKTSLEVNVPVNLVMIGIDGKPEIKNLKEILNDWLTFRFETVVRRTQNELDKVNARVHILEGRITVILNLDDVIDIVRNSENPREDIVKRYGLSVSQADDILDLRLRQLARLEEIKIKKELKTLKKSRSELKTMLADRSVLERAVSNEIAEDVDSFADNRRTKVEEAPRASAETPLFNHPVSVIFSKQGWVKSRQGWDVDPSALTFKDGDRLASLLKINSSHPVVFIDSVGRCYSLVANQLPPGRGDGLPVSSLVDVQTSAQITYCLSGSESKKNFLFASDSGYGFISSLSNMITNRKGGRDFMAIKKGETILEPVELQFGNVKYIATVSSESRLLIFPITELKSISKGRGNIMMGLHEGEKLVAVAGVRDKKILLTGRTLRGKKLKSFKIFGEKFERFFGRRARMGRSLPQKLSGEVTVDGS